MGLFATDKRQIFRQAALDRLASPDELDHLGSVVNGKGWIALISLAIIVGAAFFWSIFGTIPTRVKGKGVLLASGSVVNVESQSTGAIVRLNVHPDQMLQKGDIIATIAQPELVKEIDSLRAKIGELEAQHRQASEFAGKNLKLQAEIFNKKRENLAEMIRILNERKNWLREKIATQEKVLERGLITRQTLIDTQQNLQRTESELQDTQHQQKQITAQELELKNRIEEESLDRQLRISETKRGAEAVEGRRNLMVNVVAPCNGRVLEVMARESSMVRTSMPIISMERLDGGDPGLEAVIYLTMADGKQVGAGMSVQITPASVKREEYGFIFGKVKSVSRFPSTTEGMMNVLANDKLVASLSLEGAPIAIRAKLESDAEAVSGFRWSSGKGPNIEVTSGTLCDVGVTVREQPPLSMIIPFLKKRMGIM